MTSTLEKPAIMDDSASETLKSAPSSMNEKAAPSVRQGSRSPTPTQSIHEDVTKETAVVDGSALEKVNTSAEGTEYPTGLKLGLISLALCLSVFLMALDNTIIATAIPKITDEFHSLPDVGWYGSAYLLTTASFQL